MSNTENTAVGALSQIDHIIVLLSPSEFANIPTWLSDNFTILEGGTHSKGTSQNKLIVFQDGTYLELFSWVAPPPKNVEPYSDFPSWAKKPEGCIIDWALTGDDAHGKYDEVMQRVKELSKGQDSKEEGLDITYNPPAAGGRKRKDGLQLEWVTTRPRKTNEAYTTSRLDIPFFCHDVTPRTNRVPYRNEEGIPDAEHPCGALGIASITVCVPEKQLHAFAKLYEGILGSEGRAVEGGYIFKIDVPNTVLMSHPLPQARLFLRGESESALDNAQKRGTGIRGLSLFTRDEERPGTDITSGAFGTPITLI